jgi:hypothetical protein
MIIATESGVTVSEKRYKRHFESVDFGVNFGWI